MPIVDSSAVERFEYTAATRALDVWYRGAGHVTYFDVPLETYQAMLSATSLPVFIDNNIRGQFSFAEAPPRP